jgi:hypothetical protein
MSRRGRSRGVFVRFCVRTRLISTCVCPLDGGRAPARGEGKEGMMGGCGGRVGLSEEVGEGRGREGGGKGDNDGRVLGLLRSLRVVRGEEGGNSTTCLSIMLFCYDI